MLCEVLALNTTVTARIKSLVDQSFAVRGPPLFNCMPKMFRTNDSSYENFKCKLNDILARVSDLPSLPSYTQAASNNSLLEQVTGGTAEKRWHLLVSLCIAVF